MEHVTVSAVSEIFSLLEVQKNIRALRTQMKTAAEDDAPLRRVDSQLARETDQTLKTWDVAAVFAYANASGLAPLDASLALAALAVGDAAYSELDARAKTEANKLGLAGLRQIRNAATVLWAKEQNTDSSDTIMKGAVPTFEATVEAMSVAQVKENEERGKAANTIFQTLWKAAEPIFADNESSPEVCPVRATPLADTAAGSASTIMQHIGKHLEELADYAAAKKALDKAMAAANWAHTQLAARLPALIGLLGDGDATLKADLISYQTCVAGWRFSKRMELGFMHRKSGPHSDPRGLNKVDPSAS